MTTCAKQGLLAYVLSACLLTRALSFAPHRVAAKQLHALSGAHAANTLSVERAAEVRRELLNEMHLLSSLRHPNLLLFLGVTYDEQSHDPRSIITE